MVNIIVMQDLRCSVRMATNGGIGMENIIGLMGLR